MIAFILAGLILGVLARALAGGLRDPQVMLTVPAGVAGAVVGGVGANLLRSEGWADEGPFSVIAACVVAIIVLGLLEGGVGRQSS
ncbi:hypothetical protein ASG90_04445 [Nocardioides sp. Soil797]|nr:hypothetical protein ASG90_04445 [Nocardioides sp. Soil797]